jgi:hypothetical protein
MLARGQQSGKKMERRLDKADIIDPWTLRRFFNKRRCGSEKREWRSAHSLRSEERRGE